MRRIPTLIGIAVLILCAGPALAAVCDITGLSCWDASGKCNIKFKNKTGEASGSGGGTVWDQVSDAQTVKVSAQKTGEGTVGNSIKMLAGQNNTMNIEKKYNKGFDMLRIKGTALGSSLTTELGCEQVKQVLKIDKSCNIFVTQANLNFKGCLVVNCGDGEVVSKPAFECSDDYR